MSTERTTPFGQWLRERRRQLDLTQEAIAEATGCSSDTIRKIEAGKRRPSRQIAELLADFLGVEAEERPAFVSWARGVGDDRLPTADNRPQTSVHRPSSLPLLPTPLLGREADLARARTLLWRSTTRLLTLVGPPGIGKTSLGIALASVVEADFKDGCLYVPLGPVAEAALVPATLAEVLGVRETPSSSLPDGLRDALRNKQMLLVLDNFEHVVQAAPLVNELLAAAPQLKVLATSRSPLHLRGEKLMEVPPLEVPDPTHNVSVEEADENASVALFVERVRDANDYFKLTQENVPLVVAICARLAGLPLAIELAAARTRLLSLQSLLTRLERQLSLLAGGPRDVPQQHRTLRDSLEASYTLLGENEQKTFRRLGIFVGPFTLEAAERVAGANVDDLEAVLDQSLLHLGGRSSTGTADLGNGEGRFAMLMPVREFAVEKMDAAGEHEEVALDHARFFLDLALAGDLQIVGQKQKVWLDRVGTAYGDIRAALDWSLKNGQVEITLRMAGGMRFFWITRGYRQEGIQWLEQALAQGKAASGTARAEALNALGGLLYRNADLGAAERACSESVELMRSVGDTTGLIFSLTTLGQVLADQGEFERAIEAYQEILSLGKESGDKGNVARALSGLGRIASRRGDLAQAFAWYEEGLVIRRQLGVPGEVAQGLNNLGYGALKLGDYQRAIRYAEEGAAISGEIGNKELMSYALGVAGKAAFRLGDYERAATNFGKCLGLFMALDAAPMVAFVLEEIARVDMRRGQPAKAARLFGVAEALRESVGASVDAPDRAERDESIAALRDMLSVAKLNAAWTVGRGMGIDEAVAYAISTK